MMYVSRISLCFVYAAFRIQRRISGRCSYDGSAAADHTVGMELWPEEGGENKPQWHRHSPLFLQVNESLPGLKTGRIQIINP